MKWIMFIHGHLWHQVKEIKHGSIVTQCGLSTSIAVIHGKSDDNPSGGLGCYNCHRVNPIKLVRDVPLDTLQKSQ